MKELLLIFASVILTGVSSSDNIALNRPVKGIGLGKQGRDTYPFLVDEDESTCADSGPTVEDPAFQVDLGRNYLVNKVKLIFPPGCRKNSISGTGCNYQNADILVGNGESDTICVHFATNVYDEGGKITSKCTSDAAVGRYVTIIKHGTDRAIYLCDLQVFGELREDNIALNRLVSGVGLPTGGEDTFQFLVDGDPNTCADSGDFTENPIFKIDLEQKYRVESVRLVFSPKSECSESISTSGCKYKNTKVSVGNGNSYDSYSDCFGYTAKDVFKSGGEYARDCSSDSVTGRFVTITKKGTTRAILLCELEVFGKLR
ncbi:uncharacterized protein [Ptychodera flava]|uniref:uncharacterized protein n=1 Tax=Ptychodera flava TaxID=63121 RepID=UPI003969C303